MAEFVKLAELEQIPEQDGLVVHHGKREIGLFRVNGTVCAIDNVCPHRGGPLAEGQRDGSLITCPWHAWSFDLTDGKCAFNDSIEVERFEVRVEGGAVLVRLSA